MKTQNLSREDLLLLHLQADLSANMLFSYATGFFGSDFPRIVRIHEKLVNRCLRRRKLLQLFEDSACFAAPSPDFAVLENVAVEVTQGATYSQALCVHCIEQGHDNVLIDVQAFTSPYPQCVGCVYQGVPVQPTDSFFDPLPLSAYLDDMPTPPCSGVISWSLYEMVGG